MTYIISKTDENGEKLYLSMSGRFWFAKDKIVGLYKTKFVNEAEVIISCLLDNVKYINDCIEIETIN